MATSDWDKIGSLTGEFHCLIEHHEFEYSFNIDDDHYGLFYDEQSKCCEICWVDTYIDDIKIDKDCFNVLDITRIQSFNMVENKSDCDTCSFSAVFTTSDEQTFTIVFNNKHNGYYPHNIDIYKNGTMIYRTFI